MDSLPTFQFAHNPSQVIGVNPTAPVLKATSRASKYGMWKLVPTNSHFAMYHPETNLYLGVTPHRTAILLDEADASDVLVKLQIVGPHPEGGDAVRIADSVTGLALQFGDQDIFRRITIASPVVSTVSAPRLAEESRSELEPQAVPATAPEPTPVSEANQPPPAADASPRQPEPVVPSPAPVVLSSDPVAPEDEEGCPVDARCCNGHMLVLTVKPRNRWQSDPYDRYTCAMCSKVAVASRDPASHCGQCDYDLCGDCLGVALEQEAARVEAEAKTRTAAAAVDAAALAQSLERAEKVAPPLVAWPVTVPPLPAPFVPVLPHVVLARSAEPTPRGAADVQIAMPLSVRVLDPVVMPSPPDVPAVLPPALAVMHNAQARATEKMERKARQRAEEAARRAERHALRAAERSARAAAVPEPAPVVPEPAPAVPAIPIATSVVAFPGFATTEEVPPAVHSIEVSGPARIELEMGTEGMTIRVVPI